MMRFKKGEQVQIGDAQTIKDNSTFTGWNDQMLSMAGEVRTIRVVDVPNEIYRLEDCNWSWEDGMLHPYGMKPNIDPRKILDFLEV